VLGLDSKIGSLEPGKRADMIAISLDEANAIPLYSVTSQLIYALKASNVRDVWVNGRQLMRGRNVLTLDSAQVFAKAHELAARIVP
jgi:5-methylthioadenosine/S-adenosylhomocysteine deaminase